MLLVLTFTAGSWPQAIPPSKKGVRGSRKKLQLRTGIGNLLCSSQDLYIQGSQSEVEPTLTPGSTDTSERGQRGHSLCSSGSAHLPRDQQQENQPKQTAQLPQMLFIPHSEVSQWPLDLWGCGGSPECFQLL